MVFNKLTIPTNITNNLLYLSINENQKKFINNKYDNKGAYYESNN